MTCKHIIILPKWNSSEFIARNHIQIYYMLRVKNSYGIYICIYLHVIWMARSYLHYFRNIFFNIANFIYY